MTTPAAEHLPIDDVLVEVVGAMEERRACVLVAPPGAGKTTRVPPALAAAGMGAVWCLEPRRIAARAAARRVAAELGCRVGERVGHHVRFDRKLGPATEVVYCTEGILLARLQEDPFLEGIGAIVFDEFHERSLDADLALAMARRTQAEAREDLALLVTSATLDPGPASRFLGDAPIVRSEGRSHPVLTTFLAPERGAGGRGEERLEEHVARGVRAALESGDGDVLVFLPGVGEIRRAEERLASLRGVDVLPLYGDLPPEQQDAALRPGPRRRVVLATNVAESSVTVGGVHAVVDTGLARILRHDRGAAVDRLVLERIDRAAADQRTGRAGRLGPGRCVRLWSAVDDRTLTAAVEPEISRLDLSGPILQLALWGERDPAAFPWFEAPDARSLRAARTLLVDLGLLDDAGRITALGKRAARLPLAPRLAVLALDAAARGAAEAGAAAAALLSERDPFRRRGPEAPRLDATESDLWDRVAALLDLGDGRAPRRGLQVSAARGVLRVKDSILRQSKGAGAAPVDADEAEALARAVLAAFPDRLARRRDGDPSRLVMVGGRGLRMGRDSGVTEGELLVALDVGAARRSGDEDFVRMASAVPREWIDGGRTRVSTRPVFDPSTGRVVGRRREMLGRLVLRESDQPLGRGDDVEAVLAEAASEAPFEAFGVTASSDGGATLERLRFLRAHRPELELPAPDEEAFRALVPMLVPGTRSFADLSRKDAVGTFLGLLSHGQRVALEEGAPERLRVPSGSHLRLAYDGDRAPVLAVKIQEMFGLADTPTVAGGRVKVLLHLLAPNGRPQQVTDDLASFWSTTYAQVRKDLRGRYPKHPWPEDPLTAEPTARAKRRR